MPDRQVGDTFTVGTQEWRVYKIEDDGTICSRLTGQDAPEPISRAAYCVHRGGLSKAYACRNVATVGRYCAHHQYANRSEQ